MKYVLTKYIIIDRAKKKNVYFYFINIANNISQLSIYFKFKFKKKKKFIVIFSLFYFTVFKKTTKNNEKLTVYISGA